MRKSLVAIVAAVSGLAACQMTSDMETTYQPLNGSVREIEMPTPELWEGQELSPAGESEVWVLWPNAGYERATATEGTEWLAALVDTKAVDIRAALLIEDSKISEVVAQTAQGRIIGPGTFPPPGPCNITAQREQDTTRLCAHMLLAYAQIVMNAAADAQEAALARDGK